MTAEHRKQVRARIQTLLDDQQAGFAYLTRRHWRQVGETGARWRDRDGGLFSFRNAIHRQVKLDMEPDT